MKQITYRFISIILGTMMCMSFIACSSDDSDNENLPPMVDVDDVCTSMDDSKFMRWCYENYDVNGDGKVTKIEAAAVRDFTPGSHYSFSSIKGLEYFTGIENLSIEGTFTQIDLSRMPNLKILSVESEVSIFDFSNNSNLKEISIRNINSSDKKFTLENPTNIIIGIEKLDSPKVTLAGIVKLKEIDLTKAKVQLPSKLIVQNLTLSFSDKHKLNINDLTEDVIISGETYHHSSNSGIYWQTINVIKGDNDFDLSGVWTGDLGMFVEVDYNNGSIIYDAFRTDIEFTFHSGTTTHGEGYRVDYYDHSCPYRYTCYNFQWTVDNGRIILRYYDNPELNATIYDFRLTSSIFDGRIGNTKFTLDKTTDIYRWELYYGDVVWDSYLYIGWNGSYWYDGYYYTGENDVYYFTNKRGNMNNRYDSNNTIERYTTLIRHGSKYQL